MGPERQWDRVLCRKAGQAMGQLRKLGVLLGPDGRAENDMGQ